MHGQRVYHVLQKSLNLSDIVLNNQSKLWIHVHCACASVQHKLTLALENQLNNQFSHQICIFTKELSIRGP